MSNSIIDYKKIGLRIKSKRKEMNMTQEKLAEKVDISTFYLSKVENGNVFPSLELLALISNILNVDFAYLITGSSTVEKNYKESVINELCDKATPTQFDLIVKIVKTIVEN